MAGEVRQIGELPFDLHAQLPPPGASATLSLSATARSKSADMQTLAEGLEVFAEAARMGMLGYSQQGHASCHCSLKKMPAEPGTLNVQLEVGGLGVGAYRVLLNLIIQSHYTDELQGVSLQTSLLGQRIHSAGDVEGLPLPSGMSGLPFGPVAGAEELGDNYVVRLRFSRALAKLELEQLVQLFGDWESLIIFGGFVNSTAEMEDPPLWPGGTDLTLPNMLEHQVQSYGAGQAPLDALLSSFGWLTRESLPLVGVELE